MPRGGKREGAGRKSSRLKALEVEALKAKELSAEYGLALLDQIQRDVDLPIWLRMEACVKLQDRVWGKPAQTNILRGDAQAPVAIRVIEAVPPEPEVGAPEHGA